MALKVRVTFQMLVMAKWLGLSSGAVNDWTEGGSDVSVGSEGNSTVTG